MSLFFRTEIRNNLDGHLSRPVLQRRGLRQGDPNSLLLFSLAFETFLCAIEAHPRLHKYVLRQTWTYLAPGLSCILILMESPCELPALLNLNRTHDTPPMLVCNLQKTKPSRFLVPGTLTGLLLCSITIYMLGIMQVRPLRSHILATLSSLLPPNIRPFRPS